MAKINCSVTNCSHNKSGECYANCIDIAGSAAKNEEATCCGSYLNKLHYASLTNNVLGSGACDCLKCTVETCKFNSNSLCMLDTIQVHGEAAEYHTQTSCSSFEFKG